MIYLKNKSLLKFVALPQRFKIYIFQQNKGYACTIFFTKKYGECVFFVAGVSGVAGEVLKVISAHGTTRLLDLNKSLTNGNSVCSILSRENLYKSLMTIMIISNANQFQNNQYNMKLLSPYSTENRFCVGSSLCLQHEKTA